MLYLTSCGGFFTLWLRDTYRMPLYVRIANNDPRLKAEVCGSASTEAHELR